MVVNHLEENMNKQEAIEEINDLWSFALKDEPFEVDLVNKGHVIDIISQIDEPQKVVVPKFVADFYEAIKNDFENKIYGLCADFYLKNLDEKIYDWFEDPKNNNKPIETLVMMHKFGYEVEKEKLYTVEIPNNDETKHFGLRKRVDGEVCIGCYGSDNWQDYKYVQLTETEIKKDFAWAWQFAKEVEEK